jgi:hypothetical protein
VRQGLVVASEPDVERPRMAVGNRVSYVTTGGIAVGIATEKEGTSGKLSNV